MKTAAEKLDTAFAPKGNVPEALKHTLQALLTLKGQTIRDIRPLSRTKHEYIVEFGTSDNPLPTATATLRDGIVTVEQIHYGDEGK